MNEQIAVTAASIDEAQIFKDAGADEVILPLAGFSMTSLKAMTLEEIQSAEGASVMMNRLLFPEEMEQADQCVKQISTMHLNHLYFADPAMIKLNEKYDLVSKLIYKPETLMTSPEDASWWLDQHIFGVAISPLLTLEEAEPIAAMQKHTIFTIHGRLMMSASRRKLLSAYLEASNIQVSDKEHMDIQEISRSEHLPIHESNYGTLIETDYVLQSFEIVSKLASRGAENFLIESSGMTAEETADTIHAYRNIFNGAGAETVKDEYIGRHPSMILSEGYYMEKTIR